MEGNETSYDNYNEAKSQRGLLLNIFNGKSVFAWGEKSHLIKMGQ